MKPFSCINYGWEREKNLDSTRIIEIKGSWQNPKAKRYPNKVSTTKYKWYSFIPKGLYEQFRRVANLYFAFHAAISLTPVSPVNPITTILPLAFVIGVSMAKEGIEDIRRGRADREANNRLVQTLDVDGVFRKRKWKQLSAGNIVKVERDEFFPADLLFIFSSNDGGNCYVETANLDGETNLKIKKCLDDTAKLSENGLKDFNAEVRCEQQNPSIYSFRGILQWNGKLFSLTPGQILLRGSKLRNTNSAYGVVLFTGYETKIMMNAINPPSKRSSVEKQLDYIILFQLLLLICMSTISAVVFAVWLARDTNKHWYLRLNLNNGSNSISKAAYNYSNPVVAGILQFFTCLVLYGYFVPISLYVSLEIVKVIQAVLINSDNKIYYEETDKPASAKSSDLNEELGKVSTILSDKTGTLTQNQMEFFKCSIAGISYGTGMTEVEKDAALRSGKVCIPEDEQSTSDVKSERGFSLRDVRLNDLNWQTQTTKNTIFRFLEILAICNNIIIEVSEDSNTINYISESPDEYAFVVASKRLGVYLVKRSETLVQLKVFNKNENPELREYKLLNVLEFTSIRKRMSVIVQDPEGHLYLFCKGADDVIFERLSEHGNEFAHITKQHMNGYAEAGLRTLAIAYRVLDENIYAEWQEAWSMTKQDIAHENTAELNRLADKLECDLVLVGATAIEDKLQVGVPQAIYRLAEAGIKIWVLTGDKMETAINIGYACRLLRSEMVKHIIRLEDTGTFTSDAQENAEAYVEELIRNGRNILHDERNKNGKSLHALIIDGKALDFVLRSTQRKEAFIHFALSCDSIICCRASPIQKATVTELVRNYGKQICLAIGDGANDVGMIQKANIGVGISGMEGQQASMSADFSIAQFRFLERLLLVHGAWCYKRTTFMIKYFFYKNFVFGFSIFIFNAYTRFSGQSIYADWFLSLYNVLFTCAPVVVIAVLDQDIKASSRLNFPQLYRKGQLNEDLQSKRLMSWLINGILQAVVCFFTVVYAYGKVPDRGIGKMVGLYTVGTTMYTCVLFVVNIQIAVVIQYWTLLHHFFIWGELVLWFAFLVIFGVLPIKVSGDIQWLFVTIVATSSSFYRITMLTTVLALLPSFTMHCFSRNFKPSDNQIVQEQEKINISESVEGSKHRDELELRQIEGASFGAGQWKDSFKLQTKPLKSMEYHANCSNEVETMEVGCNDIPEIIPEYNDCRRGKRVDSHSDQVNGTVVQMDEHKQHGHADEAFV